MSGRTLYTLGRAGEPISWQRIGDDGLLDGEGALEPGENGGAAPGDFIVVSVPGDRVSLRSVQLEGTAAQARAAARLTLGPELATDPHTTHFAVGGEADAAGRRLVALVAEEDMRAWQERLLLHGIEADVLVPAPLLLPVPSAGYVAARAAAGGLDVRGAGEAFSAPRGVAEAIWREEAIRELSEAEADVERLSVSESPPLDLLQGEFARRTQSAAPGMARRAGIYIGIASLCLLAAGLVDGFRHQQGAEMLAVTIAARAEAAGIPIPAGTDPLPALRLAAAERGAGGGFSSAAQALFSAVRSSPGVAIETLEWSGGRLLADLSLQPNSSVETLRPSIEAAGYRLIAGSADRGEDGIRTSIEVTP